VPILQAIEITATSSGNWVTENALLKSQNAIREGIPIYKPLEAEPVFPPMVTRIIAAAEETGDVDGMLGRIADFYESEVDATVKALTSIIEAPDDRRSGRHPRRHVPADVQDLRDRRVATVRLKITDPIPGRLVPGPDTGSLPKVQNILGNAGSTALVLQMLAFSGMILLVRVAPRRAARGTRPRDVACDTQR
jgi:hypothetical protein